MVKIAIDQNGNEVEVSLDTVVKTKNGKHYLLTTEEQQEYDVRNQELPNTRKKQKLTELKEYYESDEVRLVTYNNHSIKIRDKALQGVSLLRGRLVDNQEITELDWFFDDNTVSTLDVNGIKGLQNFVVERDINLRKIRREHTNAIKALTDLDAIENYDIKAPINGLSWT